MKAMFVPALLMLASCNDPPKARTQAEIETIAHDAALEATNEKFDEMNKQIEDLGTNLTAADTKVDELEGENTDLTSRVEMLESHDREVRDKLAI